MSFPTLEAFVKGASIKTQVQNVRSMTYTDVTLRYVKGEYGVGHFEVREIATNKLTIESIIDKLTFYSCEKEYVEQIYKDFKFYYKLKNGQTTKP